MMNLMRQKYDDSRWLASMILCVCVYVLVRIR